MLYIEQAEYNKGKRIIELMKATDFDEFANKTRSKLTIGWAVISLSLPTVGQLSQNIIAKGKSHSCYSWLHVLEED